MMSVQRVGTCDDSQVSTIICAVYTALHTEQAARMWVWGMYCVNGEVRLFHQLHDIRSRNKEEVNEQCCTCYRAYSVSS